MQLSVGWRLPWCINCVVTQVPEQCKGSFTLREYECYKSARMYFYAQAILNWIEFSFWSDYMQKYPHCSKKGSTCPLFSWLFCPISDTKWLGNPFKLAILSQSPISVDTSAYYHTSQIYQKENWTRKQNRSVQCGQAVTEQKPTQHRLKCHKVLISFKELFQTNDGRDEFFRRPCSPSLSVSGP